MACFRNRRLYSLIIACCGGLGVRLCIQDIETLSSAPTLSMSHHATIFGLNLDTLQTTQILLMEFTPLKAFGLITCAAHMPPRTTFSSLLYGP